ncbi:MAG: phospho-sugar mutase [Flavobacteriia bacterium]|nr:phospho-sugar mutase [Flavobacteriia bacterium]
MSHNLDTAIVQKANEWLQDPIDKDSQAKVQQMLSNEPEELTESFYKDLDFGTGGMRGIMGVGTNRVNKYTLGLATQGLSNYLHQQLGDEAIKVAIAFDSRNNSQALASSVAEVFSANGIKVFLFENLRPTPELSFTIRHLGCQAGIVLTASHNPKEYNGYKVYWQDGGQLVPPHDKAIIEEVRKVKLNEVKFNGNDDFIEEIGRDVDRAYLQQVARISLGNEGKDDIKVVFTPLHGTSVVLMEDAFNTAGFSSISLVKEQSNPDGNFPTVDSPNPEEAAALKMAVDQAERDNADLVIGCDPDTDRVGIAVRDHKGQMRLLNGNQTGAVVFEYMLSKMAEKGVDLSKSFTATTIVTSNLMEQISLNYGVESMRCLTGFKWIAELIHRYEGTKKFIVGAEESYGYMIGDFVRDKDAISGALMIAEAAAYAKSQGSSFFEYLADIQKKYGFYQEHLISIVKKGRSGAEEIAAIMENLRSNPPQTLASKKVVELRDFKLGEITDLHTGEKRPTNLPSSNVIQLVNENGDITTARPSGTEPKIKFYFSVNREWKSGDYDEMEKSLREIIQQMIEDLAI